MNELAIKHSPEDVRITLTEGGPILVNGHEWPILIEAHDRAASYRWSIVVREHADGRRIVYGHGPKHEGRLRYGGFFISNEGTPRQRADATCRAIRRVAGIIDHAPLGTDCIATLPALRLT